MYVYVLPFYYSNYDLLPCKKFSRFQRVHCVNKVLLMWNTSLPFLYNWLLRRLSCVLTSSLNIFGKYVLMGVYAIQCVAELSKILLLPFWI